MSADRNHHNSYDPNKNEELFRAVKYDNTQEVIRLITEIAENDKRAGTHELITQAITPDEEGRTLLHYASNNDNLDFVRFLLDNGAQVNARDSNNGTALHWAVVNENDEMVAILLQKGADALIKNNDGETPLTLAESHKEITTLIKKHLDLPKCTQEQGFQYAGKSSVATAENNKANADALFSAAEKYLNLKPWERPNDAKQRESEFQTFRINLLQAARQGHIKALFKLAKAYENGGWQDSKGKETLGIELIDPLQAALCYKEILNSYHKISPKNYKESDLRYPTLLKLSSLTRLSMRSDAPNANVPIKNETYKKIIIAITPIVIYEINLFRKYAPTTYHHYNISMSAELFIYQKNLLITFKKIIIDNQRYYKEWCEYQEWCEKQQDPIRLESLELIKTLFSSELVGRLETFRTVNTAIEHSLVTSLNEDHRACALLLMLKQPTQETLSDLPVQSNAAYIRYNKQLFYANQFKKIFIEIKLASQLLDRFDQELKPDAKGRILLEGELKSIESITRHTHHRLPPQATTLISSFLTKMAPDQIQDQLKKIQQTRENYLTEKLTLIEGIKSRRDQRPDSVKLASFVDDFLKDESPYHICDLLCFALNSNTHNHFMEQIRKENLFNNNRKNSLSDKEKLCLIIYKAAPMWKIHPPPLPFELSEFHCSMKQNIFTLGLDQALLKFVDTKNKEQFQFDITKIISLLESVSKRDALFYRELAFLYQLVKSYPETIASLKQALLLGDTSAAYALAQLTDKHHAYVLLTAEHHAYVLSKDEREDYLSQAVLGEYLDSLTQLGLFYHTSDPSFAAACLRYAQSPNSYIFIKLSKDYDPGVIYHRALCYLESGAFPQHDEEDPVDLLESPLDLTQASEIAVQARERFNALAHGKPGIFCALIAAYNDDIREIGKLLDYETFKMIHERISQQASSQFDRELTTRSVMREFTIDPASEETVSSYARPQKALGNWIKMSLLGPAHPRSSSRPANKEQPLSSSSPLPSSSSSSPSSTIPLLIASLRTIGQEGSWLGQRRHNFITQWEQTDHQNSEGLQQLITLITQTQKLVEQRITESTSSSSSSSSENEKELENFNVICQQLWVEISEIAASSSYKSISSDCNNSRPLKK